uniref:ABC-2 family transporter protein n=1 Tax=Candidatus Kentrum sp. MB TaxID=2138164 RepID=A0A450XY05_9GAMM|nr:MAG: hypothetical protein BECKMB1821G_GA0114241_106118 [Candidatus Kentron sp. MB]VFK34181.1 MAG: hypothetical protein BECKMB1821I_GA0114274_106318 [Candidatus Kentron sp. MB]VFK76719.1 MAG: hypothetical protein BECKMB1821H_GA0114242_10712 [Candidatus Kentron sp. MB]
MNAIVTIAGYTVLEMLRNRLLRFVGAYFLVLFLLSRFIGELAIIETVSFESAFLGALLRFSTVVMTGLLVITGMVREFHDKGMMLILSLPISRTRYLLGKFMGFGALAVFLAMASCLLLLAPAPLDQVMLWGISLICELLIIGAFSLLCVFTLEQVTPAFVATMSFYLLSRGIETFQLMASAREIETLANGIIAGVMDAIAFVLPELYRFTATDWLVYHSGTGSMLLPILGQTSVYLILLTGMALFDFYRKNL